MSTSDLTPTVVLVHGAFVDAALFHDAVCAEAPADVADTLARTQRPASLAAFATAPPPPVESAGRVGSRLGKVSELTIIVPFAPGGAQRLRGRQPGGCPGEPA
jgi:hypothetical protein